MPRIPGYERSCRWSSAIVREAKITHDEWWQAIEFLTRAGKMCSDHRQEFILLSDILANQDFAWRSVGNHVNRRPDGEENCPARAPAQEGRTTTLPRDARLDPERCHC